MEHELSLHQESENETVDPQADDQLSDLLKDPHNPVLARLLSEVSNGHHAKSSYDRVHNRHNR